MQKLRTRIKYGYIMMNKMKLTCRNCGKEKIDCRCEIINGNSTPPFREERKRCETIEISKELFEALLRCNKNARKVPYSIKALIEGTDFEEQRNDPELKEWNNKPVMGDEPFNFDLEEMDKALASPSEKLPRIKSLEDLEEWLNDDE